MDNFWGFGILGVKARKVPSKADQLTTLLATVNPVGPGFWRQVSQGSSVALWGLPTPCLVLGPGVYGGAFVPRQLASCRELPCSSQQGNLCGQGALSIGRKLNHQLQ